MTEASGGYPFKVTFPAPSIFGHPLTTVVGPDDGGYASLEEFVAHAIEIERGLVAATIAAGARYIQFDFPLYPYLVDPTWIARFEAAGHSVTHVLDAALAADTAVLEGIPDDVTTALHICRGNFRSSWMCEGSLEPVAERVFAAAVRRVPGGVGRPRPRRRLRADPVPPRRLDHGHGHRLVEDVRELEDEDDLVRRMEEAATIVGGMDRLAISPQCGFASVMVGNEIDEDAQWRKLELVGRVADRLWAR